jgi:uncharacterized protein
MTQDRPTPVTLYQPAGQEALSPDRSFKFNCQAGLTCFNRCCRTPTVILSPYDLVRLKQCLGLTSGELLARYTRQETEEGSRLPLVFLDAFRSPESGCPFVGPAGCRVYGHRPAACRLFPITMGSELTAQGVVDHYFCRRLDYCQGFDADLTWTVESWQANQGFVEYDAGRRAWLEILLAKGLKGRLEQEAQFEDFFATICYDLDRFRALLREPAFCRAYGLEGATAYLEQDDLALLEFGYEYLKSLLGAIA